MKKLGLRYALLIYGLLILLLLGLMAAFWWQYRHSMARVRQTGVQVVTGVTEELLKQQVTMLMQATARQLTNPLYYTDYSGLHRRLRFLVQSPQIRFVYVYDLQGRILHDGDRSVPRYGEPVPYALARSALRTGRLRFAKERKTLLAAVPITMGDTPIGGLLVGFALDSLQSAQAAIQQALSQVQAEVERSGLMIFVVSSAGISLLGLALASLLGRHLSYPIQQLIHQAQNLGNPRANAVPAVSRNDELGKLSQVLVEIAARLHQTTVSRDYLERIVDNLSEALLVVNPAGRITFFNRRATELTGYRPEQLQNLPLIEVLEGEDSRQSERREGWLKRSDGSIVPVALRSSPHPDEGFIHVIEDLSRQRRYDEEQRLAARVYRDSPQGILIADARGAILSANPAVLSCLGFRGSSQLKGRLLAGLSEDTGISHRLQQCIDQGERWQGEIAIRDRHGQVLPFWMTMSAVRDPHGVITHFIAILLDLRERKETERRIYQLAYFDPLTRLPNRLLFQDRLHQALLVAEREHHMVALLFMDLDRFKVINDSHGHAVGDALLQAVATRLQRQVRREDTLARLGGDEFAVILRHVRHADEAAQVAEKLLKAFTEPFELDGYRFYTGASIGISLYPGDARDSGDLLKHADSAMYQAKNEGHNLYRFFTPELNAAIAEQAELEHDLRQALAAHALEVHYQPQWDLHTGRIVGLEALVRWRHPSRGWVAPDRFIPLAEESGLIERLGQWVLRTACRQMHHWQRTLGVDCRIAVNISACQFRHPQLAEQISALLAETGLSPALLELELTETVLMDHGRETVSILKRLSDLGIQLAVDDFGTGHSSLGYLKRFPLHRLKIDRTFVRHVTEDNDDAAIVKAIITLADTLGLAVIAEGVETDAQAKFLLRHGCYLAQGWLFAKALPAGEAERLLRRHRPIRQPAAKSS